MILKPDSIKTIQPNCKILTFNNVDLKFPENDCKVACGAKILPLIISFEEIHVKGDVLYKRHWEGPYIYFRLYDVDMLDHADFDFRIQDINFQTHDLNRKGNCKGTWIGRNELELSHLVIQFVK